MRPRAVCCCPTVGYGSLCVPSHSNVAQLAAWERRSFDSNFLEKFKFIRKLSAIGQRIASHRSAATDQLSLIGKPSYRPQLTKGEKLRNSAHTYAPHPTHLIEHTAERSELYQVAWSKLLYQFRLPTTTTNLLLFMLMSSTCLFKLFVLLTNRLRFSTARRSTIEYQQSASRSLTISTAPVRRARRRQQ